MQLEDDRHLRSPPIRAAPLHPLEERVLSLKKSLAHETRMRKELDNFMVGRFDFFEAWTREKFLDMPT